MWSGRLRSPDYGDDFAVRKVRPSGEIRWRGASVYISQTLAGEPVGLRETDDGLLTVMYGPVELGKLDAKGVFHRPKAARRRKKRRGFVDNADALTTSPPLQQQQREQT